MDICLLKVSNRNTNCKTFKQQQCEGAFRKLLGKNYKMFRHKTFMRKPFFSKATCSSTKKEFIHIPFLQNFEKCPEKNTKTFRKIINRACFDEYFYRYVSKGDKTYLQNSFKKYFSKCSEQMYNVKSFGRYFLFCPHLIYLMRFDGNLRMG